MPVSLTYLKICLSLWTIIFTSGVYTEPSRYDLIHYLLNEERYDHSLSPEFDKPQGNATNVSVELSIFDLNSESDINMEFAFTLYFRLNWTDNRLNFTANTTSYDSLTLGDDIIDKLWIPDLYFIHERKAELHGLFTKYQLARIYRNGTVHYSGRFSVTSHCVMDLKYFPFDSQTCHFVIQSYAFSKDELLLHWSGDDAVSVEVNAISLEFTKSHIWEDFKSPYTHPVGNFSTLNADITFRRKSESFVIIYIAPPIVLVIVSMTSFLLADSISSRVTVCTGALTQLILQWSGTYKTLPTVSDITYIDRWMLGNLTFIGFVLITNALIYHFVILKEKEKKEKKKKKNESKKCKTEQENTKPKSKGFEPDNNVPEDIHLSHSSRDQPTSQPQQQQSVEQHVEETNEDVKSRLIQQEHIEPTSKVPQENVNVEDSRNAIVASIHTSQRQQQSVEQHVDVLDERSGLIRNEQLSYRSTEREDDEHSYGRRHRNKGFNNEGTELLPLDNGNNRNESQDGTSQVVDNKSEKKENEEKKTEMKCKTEKEKKNQKDFLEDEEDFYELLKDNESITTTTKLEDVQTRLKDDPRFVRAIKRNMVSEWYQIYIHKKKKENFIHLLKEKVKRIKKWERAEKKIDHDPRYVVVDATTRKEWFDEFHSCKIGRPLNVICFMVIAVLYIILVLIFIFGFWTQ